MTSCNTHMSVNQTDASNRTEWEKLRSEIHRLYIQEDKTLEETRAEILATFGFKACPSLWKDKLREWVFVKYIPAPAMQFVVSKEEERALQGKDTVFYYGGTEITYKRIQNFKSRRSKAVASPPNRANHPEITYNTPSPSGCGSSPEEDPTYKIDLPQVPVIKVIDKWLFNKDRPWSTYDLHRPLDNHDGLLDSDDRTFDEVRDFGLPFEEAAEFCGIGTQPLANSGPAMGFEEHDRISEHAEDVALMDLFALEGKLAKCHRRYEEHSPQALEIRFALAKALKSLGKHDEAENHYRKILDKDSQIDVQAYLGMILAESDRLEESMKWLFIALTGFIVNFGDYSFQGNTSLFVLVYGLFDRLIRQNEQKWAPLKKCMTQMLATLREPKSDEHIHRICPQLFIHGLSFAYQCCLLGLISSAKCLYEYLLEHSSSHFVNNRHAFEKAVAHQRYELLLRKEKDWASSAKHLLLACKSAMKSGSYDRRLVVLLAINFTNLRPHLTTQPDEEDPLAESIELMLDRMRYQNFTSELVHVSRVEKYFESGLPRHFATFEPSAISHQMAHFTLPSITTEPSREDRNYTSTAGVSRREQEND